MTWYIVLGFQVWLIFNKYCQICTDIGTSCQILPELSSIIGYCLIWILWCNLCSIVRYLNNAQYLICVFRFSREFQNLKLVSWVIICSSQTTKNLWNSKEILELVFVIQLCKYACRQVCGYAGMQVCKYGSSQEIKYVCMQVIKYARMQISKYLRMQICMYANMEVCDSASMKLRK